MKLSTVQTKISACQKVHLEFSPPPMPIYSAGVLGLQLTKPARDESRVSRVWPFHWQPLLCMG